jgi:oxygen-independent coproporphyrinogen-3 oxidase
VIPDESRTGNYFVSTYPPFSCWEPTRVRGFEQHLDAGPVGGGAPLGLYVHIPFCLRRCTYCYYLSYDDQAQNVERYVDALLDEARAYATKTALRGRPISFAYFGGGTPSVLKPATIRRLLHGLQQTFPMEETLEVTFECAPSTVTEERAATLRKAGVTRVSMGVQQMDDDVLRDSGRTHMVKDVLRAVALLQQQDFPLLNLDLMAGMVGETDASFDRSLERILELDPESVTIYPLEIPHNTVLHGLLQAGELPHEPANWVVKRERLKRAFARLESVGYMVRSAYAAVRDPVRNRFVYQEEQYRGADLLGLGVSAFSYLGGHHQQNLASLGSYLEAVADDRLPLGRAYRLGTNERMVREFILQLKLGRVALAPFRGHFGVDAARHFREPLARFAEQGWLNVDDNAVRLTREGLVRVDSLLPSFYLPAHQGVRYT